MIAENKVHGLNSADLRTSSTQPPGTPSRPRSLALQTTIYAEDASVASVEALDVASYTLPSSQELDPLSDPQTLLEAGNEIDQKLVPVSTKRLWISLHHGIVTGQYIPPMVKRSSELVVDKF